MRHIPVTGHTCLQKPCARDATQNLSCGATLLARVHSAAFLRRGVRSSRENYGICGGGVMAVFTAARMLSILPYL